MAGLAFLSGAVIQQLLAPQVLSVPSSAAEIGANRVIGRDAGDARDLGWVESLSHSSVRRSAVDIDASGPSHASKARSSSVVSCDKAIDQHGGGPRRATRDDAPRLQRPSVDDKAGRGRW